MYGLEKVWGRNKVVSLQHYHAFIYLYDLGVKGEL